MASLTLSSTLTGGVLHFCPPESNPQRVQEKQQQQQQGVVPYLGTFLGDLLMLCLAMGDYLEEYRVMREMLLLPVVAKNYNQSRRSNLGPDSRTWSYSTRMIVEAVQELSEGRGGLSLLASPESLSPWPPAQPQSLLLGELWDTQTPAAGKAVGGHLRCGSW
ncbi:ral-GDS-related protein-like isoform X2 [Diceros bicornis minor]|uniref:ral-GDS-related protein-like isoform X2 n=1 Tax=Diceros bicornis minor TaxID=77932 RepID=UPI0026EFA94F|nr:ral-GDS-related protein-like isoform X2 [Diceros bicornis minor]